MNATDQILALIQNGNITEAEEHLLHHRLKEIPTSERYYLMGLIYSKRSDWQHAQNYFLKAIECNGHDKAAEALQMITDIYNFYYKDNLNP